MRSSMRPLKAHCTYESRSFLPIYCEYFALGMRFSPKLSPFLLPSILVFSARLDVLPGRLYV